MKKNKQTKVISGIHHSSGKAWAQVIGKLGMVEQWADTESEAIAKCRRFISTHWEVLQ